MKRKGFSKLPAGFTIAELLIVLAVTSALFLVAVLMVGGRQNETEFQQSINDVASKFQKIINQVNTGNYQEANLIQCDGIPGYPNIQTYAGPDSDSEGISTDCLFVGKIVQFATNADPQQYIVYPVAGLRVDGGGSNCADITCTNPVVIAQGNGAGTVNNINFPQDGVHESLDYGLTVSYAHYVSSGGTKNIGGFGIMSSLGDAAGAQHFFLVPIQTAAGYSIGGTPSGMKNIVDKLDDGRIETAYDNVQTLLSSSNPKFDVEICFASGTTTQSGKITIGGNGGNLNSVTTTIYSDTTC